jgi:hypothetical protein
MSGSERPTITVGSSAATAIFIHSIDPNADPEKPGLHTPERTAVIAGNRAPTAVNGLGLTHGVDAEMFDQWMAVHPEFKGILIPMSEADVTAHVDVQQQYGHEPALKAAAEDPVQAKLAAQGSSGPQPVPAHPATPAAAPAPAPAHPVTPPPPPPAPAPAPAHLAAPPTPPAAA